MFKFLIDECLSPDLAALARSIGHHAMHVTWAGLGGQRDQVVAVHAVADHHVMVTNNASDFRPIYHAIDMHPGLVIILPSVRKADQLRLFGIVLTMLAGERDLVNKRLEIDLDETVRISEFPPHQGKAP